MYAPIIAPKFRRWAPLVLGRGTSSQSCSGIVKLRGAIAFREGIIMGGGLGKSAAMPGGGFSLCFLAMLCYVQLQRMCAVCMPHVHGAT